MCKAVEEWRQEERAEGRTEGRAIGIKELRNLYNWLISTGRTADANQLMSSDDELFQNKLFLEYEKDR